MALLFLPFLVVAERENIKFRAGVRLEYAVDK
jgi:hypothetical protein